jgi:hypothetical protein
LALLIIQWASSGGTSGTILCTWKMSEKMMVNGADLLGINASFYID